MPTRILRRLAALPMATVSYVIDVWFSPRGMLLGFLMGAALLSCGAWLRPMLSHDLRGTHLPLGWLAGGGFDPATLLANPREFRWDSIGGLLLVVIGLSALLVIITPRCAAFVLGVLLTVSMMCVAMTVVGYPELIDLMDSEEEQRVNLAAVLRQETDLSLTGESPPRTTIVRWRDLSMTRQQPNDAKRGDLLRGWLYTVYGPWLVFATAGAVLAVTRGTWERRLGILGIWTLIGATLAGAACFDRLVAEFHWTRAKNLEQLGDLQAARKALATCAAAEPALEHTETFWLLAGKIDHRLKRATRERTVFRINQLLVQNDLAQCLALVDDLVRGKAVDTLPLAVRHATSRVCCQAAQRDMSRKSLTGAQDHYARAALLAPLRVDSIVGLGIVLSHTDEALPDRVAAYFDPLVMRLGDRLLRADLHERMGYAYFEAGRFTEARVHYQASLDLFSLPKATNAPAQEGMVGL